METHRDPQRATREDYLRPTEAHRPGTDNDGFRLGRPHTQKHPLTPTEITMEAQKHLQEPHQRSTETH